MKLHPLRSSRRPSAAADVQSRSSVNTRWRHCCLSVQSSTTFNLPVNVSLRRSLWRHHIQLMVKFWLRLMPRSWTCRTCNHTEAVLNLRPQKSNERTTPCPRPPQPYTAAALLLGVSPGCLCRWTVHPGSSPRLCWASPSAHRRRRTPPWCTWPPRHCEGPGRSSRSAGQNDGHAITSQSRQSCWCYYF